MSNSEENRKWHFGKEIPITTVIFIIFQSFAFAWWLSGISSATNQNTKDNEKTKETMAWIQNALAVNASTPSVNAAKIATLEADIRDLRTRIDHLSDEVVRRTPYLEGQGYKPPPEWNKKK